MSNNSNSLYQRGFTANQNFGSDTFAALSYSLQQSSALGAAAPASSVATIIGAADGVLRGTGQPGERLNLWATSEAGTYPLGLVIVQTDGSWQLPMPQLPQGGTFDMHLRDASGAVLATSSVAVQPIVQPDHPEPPQPPVQPEQPELPAQHKTAIVGAYDDSGATRVELHSGDKTADATPVLFGTGRPGERLELFAAVDTPHGKQGFPLGLVLVQDDGTWQFNVQQLPQGGLTDFELRNGNGELARFSLTIDGVQPPVQPEVPEPPAPPVQHETTILGAFDDRGTTKVQLHNGDTTGDATPVLFGTGKGGEWVYLSATLADGSSPVIYELGMTFVQGDGRWEQAIPQFLQNGTYDFHARSGLAESTFTLTLDAKPAEPVKTEILGAQDDSGALIGDMTDDMTPTLFGTGTAGERLVIWSTDLQSGTSQPAGLVIVQADGTWKHDISQLPHAGTYQFHLLTANGQELSQLTLTVESQMLKASLPYQAVDQGEWNVQMLQGEHIAKYGNQPTTDTPVKPLLMICPWDETPAPFPSNTVLPPLNGLLETSSGNLQFGGQASTGNPASGQLGGAFDVRPVQLDELNSYNIHLV